MGTPIVVGMADLKAVKEPDELTTIGLGSCVGICLFDNRMKIIGMAHAMLPDSQKIVNNQNSAKFVDTSIMQLIDQMTRLGASKTRMVAKVAGGAQMFAFSSGTDSMRIGDRNIEATRLVLGKLGIPIIAEDVGLNYGRTIIFSPKTGMVTVKTIANGIKEI